MAEPAWVDTRRTRQARALVRDRDERPSIRAFAEDYLLVVAELTRMTGERDRVRVELARIRLQREGDGVNPDVGNRGS